MGLETGTYISDLLPQNPPATDPRSQGADHLRLIKAVLKNTFPSLKGAVTLDQDTLNALPTSKQDTLGFTPIQQGGGVDQVAGKVFLGRDTTYPGLRYSYVNGGGNTVTGGYLLSTYGTELNGAYGQLGDLSMDGGARLVYQSSAMNGTYYTAALLSDVTAETARATNAESGLVSGTFEMGNGDAQGLGLHWSASLGAAMFAYGTPSDSTVVQLASHSEVVAEVIRATNAEAQLASHSELTNEVIRATNAESQLVPIRNPNGFTIYAGPNNEYWAEFAGNSGEFSVWNSGNKVFATDGEGNVTTCANIQAGTLPDTDDYQNCRWTNVMGVMTLTFIAIGTGAGGDKNNYVTFPKAFAAGSAPTLALTIDREPGSSGAGVSRFPNIAGSDYPDGPVSNTGFWFQPTYNTSTSGTSGKAFRLHVTATGAAP